MSTTTIAPAHTLTAGQRRVFAVIAHYYESISEPVPSSYVARRLGITRVRVCQYFRQLNELGWLRTPGSPAIPTRDLPPHP